MDVIILAGGRGTRMGSAVNKPKPLIVVGDRPMLCHVMDLYGGHGHRRFTVAGGYKWQRIRRYFCDNPSPYWIEVVDTGAATQTGGRLRRFAPDETFMAAYGDGIGDIDITALVTFHKSHGRLATLTASRPPARFGHVELERDGRVTCFDEKPSTAEGWVNVGFFVLEPAALDYIGGDDVAFEREPLSRLASDGQLMAFRHEGFWQPMDSMRDRELLDDMCRRGETPWLR